MGYQTPWIGFLRVITAHGRARAGELDLMRAQIPLLAVPHDPRAMSRWRTLLCAESSSVKLPSGGAHGDRYPQGLAD